MKLKTIVELMGELGYEHQEVMQKYSGDIIHCFHHPRGSGGVSITLNYGEVVSISQDGIKFIIEESNHNFLNIDTETRTLTYKTKAQDIELAL